MNKFIVFAALIISNSVLAKPTSTDETVTPIKNVKEIPSFVSKLPLCQGSDTSSWNRCVGGYVYPNKNVYYGEWRNGNRDGVGQLKILSKGESKTTAIRSVMPAIYVGHFKQGLLSGHGVWIDENGDRYEGEFKENILVFERKDGVNVFGGSSEDSKKKCESYGLKFGTAEYAQCMFNLEQLASQNSQKAADRKHQKDVQRIAKEPTAIDWFRLANEFAKPPQFMPEPCDRGMMMPPGQVSNCR